MGLDRMKLKRKMCRLSQREGREGKVEKGTRAKKSTPNYPLVSTLYSSFLQIKQWLERWLSG